MKKLLLFLLSFSAVTSFGQWMPTAIYSTGYDCISAFGKVYSSGATSNNLDVSSDEGATWTPASTGFPSGGLYLGTTDGAKLYACRGNSIYSTTSANSWSAMSHTLTSGYNVKSMTVINGTVIAAVNYIFSPLSCQTYKFNGTSWVQYGTSYPNRQFTCIRNLNGNIFAGTSGNLVLKSTDGGMTFTSSSTGMPNTTGGDKYIFCLASNSNTLFAGTQNGNICRSTDNGSTWNTAHSISTGSTTIDISDLYVSSGNRIMAATDSGFIYSANNGLTWAKKNDGFTYLSGVLYDPLAKITTSTNYIFVATKNGKIYRRAMNEIFSGINEYNIPEVSSKAYPNPANGNVTIESDDLIFDTDCEIKLTDILGREVKSVEMKSGKSIINVAEFAEGVYSYTIYQKKLPVGKGKLVIN